MKMLTGTCPWYGSIIQEVACRRFKFNQIFPASNEWWTLKIELTNDGEGSWCRNYGAASGPILKISKGFHRIKQNLYIYFSLRPGILKM